LPIDTPSPSNLLPHASFITSLPSPYTITASPDNNNPRYVQCSWLPAVTNRLQMDCGIPHPKQPPNSAYLICRRTRNHQPFGDILPYWVWARHSYKSCWSSSPR
jgi:hypothetical protein